MTSASMMMEGYLRKNHHGQPFAKTNYRRYFVAEGFTVFYYSDSTKVTVKGHFDLRNVIRLRPHDAADKSTGEGAVDLWIAEPNSPSAPKKMTLSFTLEPAKRAKWLGLICSAVFIDYVADALGEFTDTALAASLNGSYGDVEAVSYKKSRFTKRAPTTDVLTPRSSITPREGAPVIPRLPAPTGAAPESSQLDTPRPDEAAPAKDEAAVDDADEITFEITVPEGVKPGDRLQATTPHGTKVKLAVPVGAEAGTILTFALPASTGGKPAGPSEKEVHAAVRIQAHLRGMSARSHGPSSGRAIRLNATPEQVSAVTKLQASFRGHASRNEQQEASRLQWFSYYLQPGVAEWDEALALAVSPEEEAKVKQARQTQHDEETKRAKWLAHYLNSRDFAKAAELAVSPVEIARVLKARAQNALGPCACCLVGADSAKYEGERAERFARAIREYEWEVAEILAHTADEAKDVIDSKLRKQLLDTALDEGDRVEAQRLAIDAKERLRIVERLGEPSSGALRVAP